MTLVRTLLVLCGTSAAVLLLSSAHRIGADDRAPAEKTTVTKPSVEFKDLPDNPDPSATYRYKLTLELDGDPGVEYDSTDPPRWKASDTAKSLAHTLEIFPAWRYTIKGNKLEIEGWTDPQTKKFHSVKSIKFESKDLPKEYWPTIKMPPNL